ncbi:MAG: MATE family efflux transporter [Bacteroidia bacterium]|nr:MATE family efflux transporter [Bacteroidia bacterium]
MTQVSYILTGMADTFFLGQMGVTELAIGTLGVQYHVIMLVVTMGISYALTPLISPLTGNPEERKNISLAFWNTLKVSVLFSILMIPISIILFPLFCELFQVKKEIAQPSELFVLLISLSLIPLSVFTTLRMFFESFNNSFTGMWVSIRGNVLNILLNVYFIYYLRPNFLEPYNYPALATLIARVFMCVDLYFCLLKKNNLNFVLNSFTLRWDYALVKKVIKIGVPISIQFFSEVAAFTCAGFFAASFGKIQLDAHGIALQWASFTYMFGSGISNAACVLSGKYYNHSGLKYASFIVPLKLIFYITMFFSVMFFILRNYLPVIFTDDAEVIRFASNLFLFVALFQLADGIQVVCSGILRGIQEVRFPTVVIITTYSFLGIAGSYYAGIMMKKEIYGVWASLSLSLIIVAILLFWKCKMIYKKV